MNIPITIYLLHVFRNLYVAPFRINLIVNLQVYKCIVYTFVAIWQNQIWKIGEHFRTFPKINKDWGCCTSFAKCAIVCHGILKNTWAFADLELWDRNSHSPYKLHKSIFSHVLNLCIYLKSNILYPFLCSLDVW